MEENKNKKLSIADRSALFAAVAGLLFPLGGIYVAALSINDLRKIRSETKDDLDFLNFVYDNLLRELFSAYPDLPPKVRKDKVLYRDVKTDTMRAYIRGE